MRCRAQHPLVLVLAVGETCLKPATSSRSQDNKGHLPLWHQKFNAAVPKADLAERMAELGSHVSAWGLLGGRRAVGGSVSSWPL